mmetsp:Transcript_10494/g.19868  ORF Transcript_10494/g.19868 Transcript_10494/m.19868 type:complete len:213 (+) Transcript_10494:346-984(+)
MRESVDVSQPGRAESDHLGYLFRRLQFPTVESHRQIEGTRQLQGRQPRAPLTHSWVARQIHPYHTLLGVLCCNVHHLKGFLCRHFAVNTQQHVNHNIRRQAHSFFHPLQNSLYVCIQCGGSVQTPWRGPQFQVDHIVGSKVTHSFFRYPFDDIHVLRELMDDSKQLEHLMAGPVRFAVHNGFNLFYVYPTIWHRISKLNQRFGVDTPTQVGV